MNECLISIIGLTRSQNPFFSGTLSEAATISNSGLYLDEAEGFPPLTAFKDIATHEKVTLEEKLSSYRDDGIKLFKEILYKELGLRYVQRSESYVGEAGAKAGNGNLDIAYPYAGVVFDMQPYKGATVAVTALTPYFNFAGPLTVTVYKAYNTGVKYQVIETVTSFTIQTMLGIPTPVRISPVILETMDGDGKAYSYLFVYSLAAGQKPKDNGTGCGCGGKEAVMHKYLKPKGIQGVSINDMLIYGRTDKINGLLFSIEARCTGGDFICNNYHDSEFVRTAIQWAIFRKAAAVAMTDLITSRFISRETLSNRDEIGMSINIANKKAANSIAYVAEHMNMLDNDCFTCTPGDTGGAYSIQKQGLLL